MKASQIVESLGRLIAKHGDCNVKMLDDTTGNMEDVSMVSFFQWKRDTDKEFHFFSEQQVAKDF